MASSRKPWKKVLYEEQEYPDNFTDSSFLEELKKNINCRQKTFKDTFLTSSLISQEICLAIFFVIGFIYMYNCWFSAEIVFILTSLITLCGYFLYIYKESPSRKHLYNIIFHLLLAWILSPVLQTLTATISTDTIYFMTGLMLIAHLLFFDYGCEHLIVSSSLSINASTFGSLCLASRLPTPFHAFVLLATYVQLFVLCPLFLSKFGNHLVILGIMLTLCTIVIYSISLIATALFLWAIFCINVLFPIFFVRWQRYKDNIYGPWDEAVIPTNKQNSSMHK